MLNKKTILLFTFIFFSILLIVALFYLNISGKNNSRVFPTPTPYENPKDGPSGASGSIDKASVENQNRTAATYALVTKLPFIGKYFSLYYSYKGDVFILYVNPLFKDEGNAEFDSFLKENGILSRSWILNLFTAYVSPTPTLQEAITTPEP